MFATDTMRSVGETPGADYAAYQRSLARSYCSCEEGARQPACMALEADENVLPCEERVINDYREREEAHLECWLYALQESAECAARGWCSYDHEGFLTPSCPPRDQDCPQPGEAFRQDLAACEVGIRCPNGQRILDEWLCDGRRDCLSDWDEQDC